MAEGRGKSEELGGGDLFVREGRGVCCGFVANIGAVFAYE